MSGSDLKAPETVDPLVALLPDGHRSLVAAADSLALSVLAACGAFDLLVTADSPAYEAINTLAREHDDDTGEGALRLEELSPAQYDATIDHLNAQRDCAYVLGVMVGRRLGGVTR